jgi:broad specificity phosphatase PhoE
MLILVRHGRTVVNAARCLQGRSDNPLDELGLAQARFVAASIGPVDRVISSPLRRAQQTAAAFGQPVDTDERWIEYDYGSLDGTPLAEVSPETWQRWGTDSSWAPPGGESHDALNARVTEACEELLAETPAQTVVVVTHVSPIKAAIGWVLGLSPTAHQRTFLDVASVTRIDLSGRSPVLRSFNETHHLL